MKLTVFGATGGVGQQIVSQALDRGHSVTAVVRDAARLPVKHAALTLAVLPTPDLQNSAINWTVVRPPKLNDKPLTGKYRIALGANVARGYSVARADVAELMLNALDEPAMQWQAVGIAY